MEKQASIARRPPAKLVVPCLSLSCFLIFLSFSSVRLLKTTTPPFARQTFFHLRFNPFLSAESLEPTLTAELKRDPHRLSPRSSVSDQASNLSTTPPEFPDLSASDDDDEDADADAVTTSASRGASADETPQIVQLLPGKNANINTSPAPVGATEDKDNEAAQEDLRAEPVELLLHNKNGNDHLHHDDDHFRSNTTATTTTTTLAEEIPNADGECDVTRGKWVYDHSYPLYTNNTCPFIDEGFNCEANGRLDRAYMKWRWQPHHCHFPRFSATKMLELIRGKRLVFVGDSINRNQWESLLCLLTGAIQDPTKVYETHGRTITKTKGNYAFKFLDYKCTVEFYVSHFLVREGKARLRNKRLQTLRIDTIDKGSSRWRGADILVFNSAHWWSHHKNKAGINYYQERDQIYPRLQVSEAFRKAVSTWASWVDRYVNPRKTRVFFRSSSPSHFSGGQWNSGGHCKEATQPSNASPGVNIARNGIVKEVLKQMKTPVTFLSITGLSSYRIDGHPSVYGRKSQKGGIQDCSHWCLPGVPDAWNELLYYHLQYDSRNSITLS